ncbi:MAG: hypothetical protein ACT4PV_11145 [Planctomycetaceae bacterium]
MRILPFLLFLSLSTLAGDSEVDALVDKLFDSDPAVRAKARTSLVALGEPALTRVLARLEARQEGPTVVRIHGVADLEAEEVWWGFLLRQLKTIEGAELVVGTAPSTLIVRATPAIQERVEQELRSLREFLGRIVSLKTRLVRLTKHLDDARGAERLASAALPAFLERHGAESIAAPQLACRNGQKASITITREVAYVADFELDSGRDGALIVDPVVESVTAGVILLLRPVAAADGSSIRIAMSVQIHELDEPLARLEFPLPTGTSAEIQVPAGRKTEITRVIRCDRGTVTIVELGGDRLLLLEAELLAGEVAELVR